MVLTSVHDKETDHSKLFIHLSDMIRFFFIPLLFHYGIRTVLTIFTLCHMKNILIIEIHHIIDPYSRVGYREQIPNFQEQWTWHAHFYYAY